MRRYHLSIPQLRGAVGRAIMACVLSLSPFAAAQALVDYNLDFAVGENAQQVIEPGATGDYELTVHSTDLDFGDAEVTGAFESPLQAFSQYSFVPSDPTRCWAPRLHDPDGARLIVFLVVALNAHESRTCRYTVTRALTSIDDFGFRACGQRYYGAHCGASIRRGSLPDLSLSLEPVSSAPDAVPQPLVRLRLTNHSSYDVAPIVASTECREFNGGLFDVPPYTIETGFPGACVITRGEDCANFTGTRFTSLGFNLGPVPAGGSSSCLLHLNPRSGAAARPGTRVYLYSEQVTLSSGGIGFDPDAGNDDAMLGVFGQPNGIPLPRPALVLIGLLLGAAGLIAIRRRTKLRTD